jgi:hypothetical protein
MTRTKSRLSGTDPANFLQAVSGLPPVARLLAQKPMNRKIYFVAFRIFRFRATIQFETGCESKQGCYGAATMPCGPLLEDSWRP